MAAIFYRAVCESLKLLVVGKGNRVARNSKFLVKRVVCLSEELHGTGLSKCCGLF